LPPYNHIRYSDVEIKWRATGTLIRLHKKNKATYDKKVNSAKASPALLAVLAGLMVAAVVHVAFQG
jgi:hypothetical protein